MATRHIWYFFILFCVEATLAQPAPPIMLNPELRMSKYALEVWEEEDGLPQMVIKAIVQGPEGYLWLGTQVGLVRFDGVTFKNFSRRENADLGSSYIEVLVVAKRGGLWLGTDGGGISHFENGQFTTYTLDQGLSSDAIMALREDQNGHLWIGTRGAGLSRFDGSTFFNYGSAQGLTAHNVLAIENDQEGNLWVGTEEGLFRYHNDRFSPLISGQLGKEAVTSLLVDNKGNLWIGTLDGQLCTLAGGAITCYDEKDGLESGGITTILEDNKGTLWVGTKENGVVRFYAGRFSSFSNKDGLTHNLVRALFQDREGSLWIGTEGGGLNRLRGTKFATYATEEGLANEVVLSVMEDREGNLWIGTDGGGLNRVKEGKVSHFAIADGLSSDFVYALGEDHQGRIWIGLSNGGICEYREDGFNCLSTSDGLSSNNVYSIFGSSLGELWVGTDAGLNRVKDGKIRVFGTDHGLSNELITAIYEDARENLWIGTYGGGLNLLRREEGDEISITTFAEQEGVSIGSILTLHEDEEGNLWVGTQGGGLCRFRDHRFTCFGTEDGLESDDVIQILEDEQGYLWLGSLSGISRVRKADLYARANGTGPKVSVTVFGPSDGLKSSETNGGTQPAAWRSRDGRLWFSTMKGLAVFDPSIGNLNTLPPPVIIERFLVSDEPQPMSEIVTLPHGKQRFVFEFTALSFISPDAIGFRYQLEGFDEAWINIGSERSVSFSHLPPGRYRFKVQARNSDGVWNEEGASVAFVVKPLFHETPVFFLLVAIAVALTGTGVYKLRIRQMKAREKKLQTIVDEQTQELRSREKELEQLNANLENEVQRQLTVILEQRTRYERELITAKDKAEESARLRSTILTNMSHEIRTPISAILGFSQILAEEVGGSQQEFVQYIRESGERLQNTLNAILDLSRLESDGFKLQNKSFDLVKTVKGTVFLLSPLAKKKGLTLQSECTFEQLFASLDETAIERILQNLIGNAIKFTERGEVVVRLDVVDERIRLCVSDTGIGISDTFLPALFEAFKQESDGLARSHDGTGLGLSITKRLIELMKGEIIVESEKGIGSTFTVYLPLIFRDAEMGTTHQTSIVNS